MRGRYRNDGVGLAKETSRRMTLLAFATSCAAVIVRTDTAIQGRRASRAVLMALIWPSQVLNCVRDRVV